MTSQIVSRGGRAGAADLSARYARIRGTTRALTARLTPEDCAVQSMPEASPVKWHLAHTTWFFETFVLSRVPRYRVFAADFQVLFNSYYDAVGPQFPRPRRGLLTRPPLDEILRYREHVDEHVAAALAHEGDERLCETLLLGLHHEQQHQELLLTDVKHLFSENPRLPAYAETSSGPHLNAPALRWVARARGTTQIGAGGGTFSYDNERPRHTRLLHDHEIASRLVTNGEYLQFVEDGGYERPGLWLSDGWAVARREGWTAPLYWDLAGRRIFTLGGARPLDPHEPVCHVSFYEADAYARWAGARLPLEDEWEAAAAEAPVAGNLLDSGRLHPARAPCDGAIGQLFGDVWEWTSSPYVAYPGYRPEEGALGEYNGKFMCNQMVLRGGSCATPGDHVRATYRNFFHPHVRWQFTGIRLARTPTCVAPLAPLAPPRVRA